MAGNTVHNTVCRQVGFKVCKAGRALGFKVVKAGRARLKAGSKVFKVGMAFGFKIFKAGRALETAATAYKQGLGRGRGGGVIFCQVINGCVRRQRIEKYTET